MSYTDKELQLATQIAYMNISEDDIKEYRDKTKTDGYPTLQWLLTESDRAEKIEEEFMSKYDESEDEDSIPGIRRDSSQTFIDDIISGDAECANWKIVSVCDENSTNGLYGCIIETGDNEAIIGFRGSEVLGLKWSAVDYDNKTISINHKLIENKNGLKCLDVMKTKSSYRTLPLIPQVEEALLKEKQKQEEMKRVMRRAYRKKYEEYICV